MTSSFQSLNGITSHGCYKVHTYILCTLNTLLLEFFQQDCYILQCILPRTCILPIHEISNLKSQMLGQETDSIRLQLRPDKGLMLGDACLPVELTEPLRYQVPPFQEV